MRARCARCYLKAEIQTLENTTMKKIATVGLMKVYRDVEWNEYVVKHPTNPNAHYHTDDKDDAMDTAAAMDREHARNLEREQNQTPDYLANWSAV